MRWRSWSVLVSSVVTFGLPCFLTARQENIIGEQEKALDDAVVSGTIDMHEAGVHADMLFIDIC